MSKITLIEFPPYRSIGSEAQNFNKELDRCSLAPEDRYTTRQHNLSSSLLILLFILISKSKCMKTET